MKKRIFLVLFSIIAVLAIISCEATTGGGGSTGGGKTDTSNQNFLNGTSWKNNSIYEEKTITILLFTKTNFDIKIYVDDVLFGHATGTYVYDAGEKKVTTTTTNIIKHPENKTIDNFEENKLIEKYEIIEDGAKMIYANSDGNNYFVKQ